MKSINEVTLYELGGEDHDVWLSVNKQFGFNLEIENEAGETFVEEGLHPYAAESLAHFCRSYLRFYDKAVAEKEAA